MNTNWNARYAEWFVLSMEKCGVNKMKFERRFNRMHEKQWGREYHGSWKTVKTAYQRHATINRFLNYKQKNLCDMSNEWKEFAVWLMTRNERVSETVTSLGYCGKIDKEDEVVSDFEPSIDGQSFEQGIVNDIRNYEIKDDIEMKPKKRRRLSGKKRPQIKYISLDDSDDDQDDTIEDDIENNNNNNDTSIGKRGYKRPRKKINQSHVNNKEIKGVNNVKDVLTQLSDISPTLKELVETFVNNGVIKLTNDKKKKNGNIMYKTLLKLQEQTKQNKLLMTKDNMKDILDIFIDIMKIPTLDLINILCAFGCNKKDLFFLWLNNNDSDIISASPMMQNCTTLINKRKFNDFLDIWMCARCVSRDDTEATISYINNYLQNIRGCIPFKKEEKENEENEMKKSINVNAIVDMNNAIPPSIEDFPVPEGKQEKENDDVDEDEDMVM